MSKSKVKTTKKAPKAESEFSFSRANLLLAKKQLTKYPEGRQQSAVKSLLYLAQEQEGGKISIPAMEYIASFLAMPVIRVLEVASFYTLFNIDRPPAKYHIQICGTTPCWLCGSDELKKNFEKLCGIKTGETSKDGTFMLSEVECLGACRNAPMAQINNDFYEELNEEGKVSSLIDKMKQGKL